MIPHVEGDPDPAPTQPFAAAPPDARRVVDQLAHALGFDPSPRTSLLLGVDVDGKEPFARFECGEGSLEHLLLDSAASDGTLLPLPVTLVLRAVCDVGAALSLHADHHGLALASRRLGPEHVLSSAGDTMLDVSALTPSRSDVVPDPDPSSLIDVVYRCVTGATPAGAVRAPVRELRPGLPSSLVEWIDSRFERPSWIASLARTRHELDRLFGVRLAWPRPTERSPSQIVRWQLGLLPAAHGLLGPRAVEHWFENNARRWVARVEPFAQARERWASERALDLGQDLGAELYSCRLEAQVRRLQGAQEFLDRMRFAVSHDDASRARLEAARAVAVAPERPEVWLATTELWAALAEPSAVALSLAEALCAARGAADTVDAVAHGAGVSGHAELARYFAGYGHPTIGRWLHRDRARAAAVGEQRNRDTRA